MRSKSKYGVFTNRPDSDLGGNVKSDDYHAVILGFYSIFVLENLLE